MTQKQAIQLAVVCIPFEFIILLLWYILLYFKSPQSEIKGMNECLLQRVPPRGGITLYSSFNYSTILERG